MGSSAPSTRRAEHQLVRRRRGPSGNRRAQQRVGGCIAVSIDFGTKPWQTVTLIGAQTRCQRVGGTNAGVEHLDQRVLIVGERAAHARRTFSIFLPLASSSTSLSR